MQPDDIAKTWVWRGLSDLYFAFHAAVHPRVIVARALELNAAAVLAGHNHPSGNAEPSVADRAITHRLKHALELLDIRLLDHFIVGQKTTSMAEKGMLSLER